MTPQYRIIHRITGWHVERWDRMAKLWRPVGAPHEHRADAKDAIRERRLAELEPRTRMEARP